MTCFGHVRIGEALSYHVITGVVGARRNRREQQEKILDRLTKWSGVGQVTDALKETRDQDAKKFLIANTRRHDT